MPVAFFPSGTSMRRRLALLTRIGAPCEVGSPSASSPRMIRKNLLFLGVLASSCATAPETEAPSAGKARIEYACDEDAREECLKKAAAELEAGDRDAAGASFGQACEYGVVEGCRRGAVLAVEGEPDFPRAEYLLRTGCTADDAESCGRLARLFAQPIPDREPDLAQALQFFARACKLGRASACTDAGLAFERGLGTPQDLTRAVVLLKQSCEGDFGPGCYHYGAFLRRHPDLPHAAAESANAFERGCTLESLDACASFGIALSQGAGVEVDEARARDLFAQGCEGNHIPSCTLYGLALERQEEPDHDAAKAAYRKACDAGDLPACKGFDAVALGACPEGTKAYAEIGAYSCRRSDGTQHGPYRAVYQAGRVRTMGTYRDGQKDGEWLTYHPDGSKQTRETFVNGELDGVVESWYPDGTLRAKTTYEEGSIVGVATTFFPNGQVRSREQRQGEAGFIEQWRDDGSVVMKGSYADGRRVGVWTYYAADGSVLATNELGAKGSGELVAFDAQGRKLESGQVVNGLRSGVWSVYAPDGKVAQKITYRRDQQNGAVTAYHPSGEVSAKGTLRAGKRNGKWQEFFPDGRPRFEVRFSNDLPIGQATEYDSEGRVLRQVKFPNRPLVQGQIALYRDSFGVRHGTYVSYHQNGEKAQEEVWELGELVESKRWDESGELVTR